MAAVDKLKKDTFKCCVCGKPSKTRFYCSPGCQRIYVDRKKSKRSHTYCLSCHKILDSSKLLYCSEKCYRKGQRTKN